MGCHVGNTDSSLKDGISAISFEGIEIDKNASFGVLREQNDSHKSTRFAAEVRFTGAHFKASADFRGARFDGITRFDLAKIDGRADFQPALTDNSGNPIPNSDFQVSFLKEVSFEETRFGASAHFNGAFFGGNANFRGASFDSQAQFKTYASNTRIFQTEFKGEANFRRVRINDLADFAGVQFTGSANFWMARVNGNAIFSAMEKPKEPSGYSAILPSRFMSGANFVSAHIVGGLDFSGAQFLGPALFGSCSIDGSLAFNVFTSDSGGERTFFGDRSSFIDCRVHGTASFEGAEVFGSANFTRFCIDSNVFVRATYWRNQLYSPTFFRDAIFLESQFGGTADFRGVVFMGPCNFGRVQIGGQAAFQCRQVARHLAVTWFNKEVVFSGSKIGGSADFDGALFRAAALFNDVTVEQSLRFGLFPIAHRLLKNVFAGRASFLGARLGGDFELASVRFLGDVDFQGIRVGRNALLRGQIFQDKPKNRLLFRRYTRFLAADVLGACDCSAICSKGLFNFVDCTVRGEASFSYSSFQRETRFNGSQFGDLVKVNRSQFRGNVDFNRVRAKGGVSFENSVFVGELGLRDSDLESVSFGSFNEQTHRFVNCASFGGGVDLRGLRFENLTGDWETLFNKLTPYDRQAYIHLDDFFRSKGDDREADRVYLKQRHEEHRRLKHNARLRDIQGAVPRWRIRAGFRQSVPLLIDCFQRHILRYGIRPLRILILWFCFLLLGTYAFSRPGAIVAKDSPNAWTFVADTDQSVNYPKHIRAEPDRKDDLAVSGREAFGYSLRLLIPFLELPSSHEWVPSPNKTVFLLITTETYAIMHRLAGFVLIPAGIAALVGLLVPRKRG